MRVGMLDVIRQDYIKTARAKGLTEKLVIYKHALKNALIPVVTILSAILPALIGGSIIIEEIFSIDGMGRLAFEAILNRDYPIINAIAFFSAFLTLVGILLSDILYAVIDPRIKFKGSKI
jgi:peptide/nickel transport system permease protein